MNRGDFEFSLHPNQTPSMADNEYKRKPLFGGALEAELPEQFADVRYVRPSGDPAFSQQANLQRHGWLQGGWSYKEEEEERKKKQIPNRAIR